MTVWYAIAQDGDKICGYIYINNCTCTLVIGTNTVRSTCSGH